MSMQRSRVWLAVGLALALIVALIVAAYIAANASIPADDDGLESAAERGDAAAASRTPLQSASPAATRAGSSAATPAVPGPVSYDLSVDEKKGGHTLERHVGKSDAELVARLKAEPGISAASAYVDRAAAERTVARGFELNAARVEAWKARKGDRPNLVLDIDMPSPIGRTMRRGERAREADSAVIVLRWDGKGGYVLTSYPQER